MSTTVTPNMNLIVPTVGSEPGPDYAIDINTSLSLIDDHDHSPGKGVQITPDGLNLNADVTLTNNFLIDVAGITLQAQLSTPANSTIYEYGDDLFYVDGLGNDIQITADGGIAGTPGSIANLTSPASASYVSASQTFVWQSDANIAANMDAGALLLRNLSPNSTYALTLQPPTLSSNFSLTLPTQPNATKIMSMTSSGIMSASYVVDNSSIEISTNTIQVKALGIATSMIAAGAVTGAKIASATITGSNIESDVNLAGDHAAVGSKYIAVSNTNASKGLSIIRGGVSSVGAAVQGEGFSAVRNSLGVYRVTFTTAFGDVPAVMLLINNGNPFIISTTSVTSSNCDIQVLGQAVDMSFTQLADNSFDLIIIGRRA